MKTLLKKNKVLFLTVAIVLACGICLAVVLINQTHIAMAGEKILTAEAEAAESIAVEEPAPEPTPDATTAQQPTADTALSADELSNLVWHKEMRREYIIPSLDNTLINEAETWKAIEPDDLEALKTKALPKAAEFAKAFFGYEMANDAVDFSYYTDTSGHRGDFISVYTTDDAVMCTLTADTLELIEIDYYFTPGSAQTEQDFDISEISDSCQEIADSIATVFDTSVSDIYNTGGGGGNGIWTYTYALEMENGKLAQFAVMNGTLYAVGVYPSEASLWERVYFDADVQRDSSLVKLASEQSFKKGEPGADDMTQEEAQDIYQVFLTFANGDEQYDKTQMTFYIDNTGARENYWHMEGKKLNMDISSKSKWIISLTCNNLWNPKHDLTKTDDIAMGGREYTDYVANIMGNIYDEGFSYADVNGVYDDHFCTEDAYMDDGSIYEFEFADGKLKQVFFYADEDCFRASLSGWKADHEYINTTTGEKFIQN